MLDSTDPVPESPGTVLALLDTPLVPQIFRTTGSLEGILTAVEAKVRKELDELDISLPKDRRAMRSLGLKVAKTKTGLDGLGKDATAEIDKVRDAVLDDRKAARDRLDALRREVDQPVDDFEAADERRVEDHEAALRQMAQCAWWQHDPTIEDIDARKAELAIIRGRPWQEFEKRAGRTHAEAEASLDKRRAEVIADSEAAAEAARVAAELAEQERLAAAEARRLREEQIAAEAAEAARIAAETASREAAEAVAAETERVRKEAAAQAAAELAAAEQAKWAIEEQARQEREAAEARDAAAATDRKRLEQRVADNEAAARRAKAQAEATELRRQQQAEASAKLQRLAIAQAAKDAAAKARRDMEDAARKTSDDAAERGKDRAHRVKIHGRIVAGLALAGLTDAQAVAVVEVIAGGQIPHVSISY